MKARSLGALLLFVIVATANSGGYRYGVGDQAFYQPATLLRLQPGLFPRDRALIESQARLTIVDEVLATSSRLTRLDPPQLFFVLYLLTLALTFLASAQLATTLGLSPAATGVFLTLLTLRHRIAKTGANTLEGYMHPRQLAFAVGIFALSASFKRRWVPMGVCWVIAAAIHPTTALWFAAAIAGHLLLSSGRKLLAFGVIVVVALLASPIARLTGSPVMDGQWLAVLEGKDYLFPSAWPPYAWILNLAYFPLIVYLSTLKMDQRLVGPSIILLGCFVASYGLVESHVALAVQLQISRVFWLMDFFVTLLIAWALIDSRTATRSPWISKSAIAVVLLLSIGRGVYTLTTVSAERSIARIDLPANDWIEAMSWLRSQPPDWLVLAHPDHAWLYGTSVRVAASRDVVVESVKDSAISMYDRGVAMRTAERLAALSAYETLDGPRALAIGKQFGATVAVTDSDHPLALPVLHRNASFAVYDLR
jgi:hypothetical protein